MALIQVRNILQCTQNVVSVNPLSGIFGRVYVSWKDGGGFVYIYIYIYNYICIHLCGYVYPILIYIAHIHNTVIWLAIVIHPIVSALRTINPSLNHGTYPPLTQHRYGKSTMCGSFPTETIAFPHLVVCLPLGIPSGSQTWQRDICYKWMVSWEHNLSMVRFPANHV